MKSIPSLVLLDDMPADLAARLLPVVAQWEFTRCRDAQGIAAERKVILPLTLVEGAF